MPQQLLVITNSAAGSADREAINKALTVLREEAWVEVRSTRDLDELSGALTGTAERTVVVAGGDGSIHAVVQCLHDLGELAGRTLALLPLGTGNDFARALGIPRSARKAARIVLEGHSRPTDLIVDDEGQVTVNNVHIGAGADAGQRGARWKKRLQVVSGVVGVGPVGLGPANLGHIGLGPTNLGKLGYPIGALQTAISPPVLNLRIEVDGEVVAEPDEKILMVAVGNGPTVGGGTALTPDADPHDGLVDVLIATPASLLDQVGYVLRLQAGSHETHAEARFVRGRSITVSGTPFDCNSDGEFSGPVGERTWQVLPAAYSMVVPA
ncbi:diacylglycerol/lipid kinase family protein [Nocardioides caeni]|uniref:diacylglycerol/lipid kinase family protein n=1 Tax=Nocardioides caeni TaxID=574700 RepID=UPI001EE87995|nr:diacylglycerol kinase family protein [Nocardioides caeni]